MSGIFMVCPRCGSRDVVRDGALGWDEVTGSWSKVEGEQDSFSCNACGEEDIAPVVLDLATPFDGRPLVDKVRVLVRELFDAGFGKDEPVDGAEAVDIVNAHLSGLVQELAGEDGT